MDPMNLESPYWLSSARWTGNTAEDIVCQSEAQIQPARIPPPQEGPELQNPGAR